ncbi:competence protein ComK [Cytobacillus sp. IB215665]|uniref:competence protein ComK n=1 Tax=Cytobacillus sp. IB215665 TaxID=3097357 RepID=UPI002A0CB650|nr:competence protein ComK [Cytobacillus sp. IB215665]MDX8363776.1 competence protein ComK [Cytobacillus sp. IB215665]
MEKVLLDYEINQSTMVLLPATHCDYDTIVYEQQRQIVIAKTPLQLVKAACLDGGATYEGRRAAVTHLTGSRQKVPIPINPQQHIFAFPTQSPQRFENSWIFHHHIKQIQPYTSSTNTDIQSIITFTYDQQLQMKESHYILEKQMHRTAMCIFQFTSQQRDSMRHF